MSSSNIRGGVTCATEAWCCAACGAGGSASARLAGALGGGSGGVVPGGTIYDDLTVVRGFSLAPRTAGSCIATRNSVNNQLLARRVNSAAQFFWGFGYTYRNFLSDHAAHSLYLLHTSTTTNGELLYLKEPELNYTQSHTYLSQRTPTGMRPVLCLKSCHCGHLCPQRAPTQRNPP